MNRATARCESHCSPDVGLCDRKDRILTYFEELRNTGSYETGQLTPSQVIEGTYLQRHCVLFGDMAQLADQIEPEVDTAQATVAGDIIDLT